MRLNYNNSEKYVKRVLFKLLNQYIIKWLGSTERKSSFKLTESVNFCGQHKMDLVKYHVESLMEEEPNLQYVYEEIKNFREFKDLLNYLSPHPYDTPESTLLEIIRNNERIIITEHCSNDYYKYKVINNEQNDNNITEKISKLNSYFRSYVKIIFDLKKRAFTLNQLYKFFLEEEIEYSLAKNSEEFLYFKENKSLTVKEIIKLIEGEEIKTPKEIYFDIIKKDYSNFYRIIDEYYGLKDWPVDVKFDVYLKLFDHYWQEKIAEKYKPLGDKVLDLMPEKELDKSKKKKLEKNIKWILERG